MNDQQARQAIGVLAAYYRVKLPPSTVAAWSVGLADLDVRDAVEAANTLGRSSKFLPSLAEFLAETRARRNDRVANEPPHPALGDGGEPGIDFATWVREYATDEQRATVARVAPGLVAKFGVDVERVQDDDP